MKKILKIGIGITILMVFLFSGNAMIEKIRNVSMEKGGKLYEKGINKLKSSNDTTAKKVGDFLEPKNQ